MSNHLKAYTGYQKRVIKGVAELLEERPFSYKKKNNNHLEIKVKGIDRVFYTSATPSDHRAYENFLSDIKIELRKLSVEEDDQNPVSTLPEKPKDARQASLDKITRTIIKRIRMNIDKIQKDEYDALLSHDTANEETIPKLREALIDREIDLALKSKHDADYFPPGMIKQRKLAIRDNLDFMLPPIAYYHEKLKDRLDQACSKFKEDQPDETQNPHSDHGDKEKEESALVQPDKPTEEKKGMDLKALAKAKRNKRLSEIKQLSKSEIASLIEDFQKALEQKHEEDILDLVTQIKEKGVTLAEIQERLE
ncbi:MAG: hypothetical protein CMI12_12410 [Oceanospirillum sp.]|nr:hypothetical protein [Oceanospirillum sp.]